ncbi:MAG: radical SAM family heme chaperone HemW, partial [Muribaculaceae bacterium]|nr:radical SAM family heme chaperone HemW [Muribaculaceae bacterium]
MAGVYIHIPFCRSKCFYCDFFSRPDSKNASSYTDALLGEWRMRRHELTEPVETIYIGGGTPSVLPHHLLEKLIGGLTADIDLTTIKEFTIEANPEDISADSLSVWKSLGITRVSIGIQSFSASELMAVGRRHSPESAIEALSALSQSGINYNADLIFGLPGQNLDTWKRNLNQLLDFKPPHFSAYLLSYEQGTRLYAMKEKGMVIEASDNLAIDMYRHLCTAARNHGYRHYEISNFSLPGKEAKHNSSYWNYTPYLGLGAAAHSFDGLVRRYNPPHISRYIKSVSTGIAPFETDEETVENRFNDYLI